ncbi:MAG: hypothetical protein PWP24_5 [Clostridiales bacterium]|nr:hypothetical protein [Clostridiales bacterium]
MKQKLGGIFDYEMGYSMNLMEFLNQIEAFPYQLRVFTSMETLNAYLAEHSLDLLLIAEEALVALNGQAAIEERFLLSKEESSVEGMYPSIFKYQSAERILSSIQSCQEDGRKGKKNGQTVDAVSCYGVVSANGGSGKTTFSFLLSKYLAKQGRTLYISFEALGTSFLEESQGGNLSDVIYYVKQRKNALLLKIQSLAVSFGEVDCIKPVLCYQDLEEITEADLEFLMEELYGTAIYQYIVFDFGVCDRRMFYLLEHCKEIYEVKRNQKSCFDKQEALKQLFHCKNKEVLYERMRSVIIPEYEKFQNKRFWQEGNHEAEFCKLQGWMGAADGKYV